MSQTTPLRSNLRHTSRTKIRIRAAAKIKAMSGLGGMTKIETAAGRKTTATTNSPLSETSRGNSNPQ